MTTKRKTRTRTRVVYVERRRPDFGDMLTLGFGAAIIGGMMRR